MGISYFTGCTALITGATAGLGTEFAKQLAPHAHTLVLVGRRADRLQELEQELLRDNAGLTVYSRPVDLSDEAQVDGLAEWVKESGITLNLLINNAGLGDHGDFAGAEWKRIKSVLAVNITALTKLTFLLLPALRHARPSAIINVSSIAAFMPVTNSAVYAASKAYVSSFSEALRAELRGTGIRLTTVCPGPVDTEFGIVAERADKASRLAPPDFLKVSASQVVEESLLASAYDRPRVIPGIMNVLTVAVLCALPMFIIRMMITRAARPQD